jgi:hypothetical protein
MKKAIVFVATGIGLYVLIAAFFLNSSGVAWRLPVALATARIERSVGLQTSPTIYLMTHKKHGTTAVIEELNQYSRVVKAANDLTTNVPIITLAALSLIFSKIVMHRKVYIRGTRIIKH